MEVEGFRGRSKGDERWLISLEEEEETMEEDAGEERTRVGIGGGG